MVTAVSNKSNYLYGLYGPIYSTYGRHMTWKSTVEVFSESTEHSSRHAYSIQFIVFDALCELFATSFGSFLLFAPLFQSHDCPDIEGILPKGPYPPCLRMADRPFWQHTLDIWLAQLQWRRLAVNGYNYPYITIAAQDKTRSGSLHR